MSDNKLKKGYQDDAKIDPNDRNELAYIKRRYGWTAGNIMVAIHVLRSRSRKRVLAWLKDNWPRISTPNSNFYPIKGKLVRR